MGRNEAKCYYQSFKILCDYYTMCASIVWEGVSSFTWLFWVLGGCCNFDHSWVPRSWPLLHLLSYFGRLMWLLLAAAQQSGNWVLEFGCWNGSAPQSESFGNLLVAPSAPQSSQLLLLLLRLQLLLLLWFQLLLLLQLQLLLLLCSLGSSIEAASQQFYTFGRSYAAPNFLCSS